MQLKNTFAFFSNSPEKVDNTQKAQNGVLEEIFTLYEHCLGKKVRPLWTELVTYVSFSLDWRNEKGKTQSAHRGYSWTALELVHHKWLLSVFTNDADKEQRMYLGYYLKFPSKISILMFFTRMD